MYDKRVTDTQTIIIYNDPEQLNGNSKEHDRGIYSWKSEYISEEKEDVLQRVMELTDCNVLYQEVGTNKDPQEVAAFLQRRGKQKQKVYFLCGDASWAIEKNAESMLNQLSQVVAYNEAAGEYKFVGIQFDVEPHGLDDFEEHADEYMAQLVENCKTVYEAAREEGILIEICIPYWWDDSSRGYDDLLEDLIANGCDSIAVMNYYKKNKELSNIQTEVELCRKYGKGIVNATETMKPGDHGLTENNTYHYDGVDAIEKMWNLLDGFIQYDKMGYAFHHLDMMIEILERDQFIEVDGK